MDPKLRIVEADSLPYGGITEGPQAWFNLVKRVFHTWKDTELTTDRYIAEGDDVVVLAEMRGKGKTSNREFTEPIIELWQLENGKVTEIRPFYFDTKLLHDVHSGKNDQ